MIPPKRLAIMPEAIKCVRCVERSGDVPKVRRYDDYNTDGETVAETYFTRNPYLELAVNRLNSERFLKGLGWTAQE